jgi:hypothetical protein
MNNFFEFEENMGYEDEYVPGLTDFYRNYALKIINKAGIQIPNRFPSLAQLVKHLEQLSAKGNSPARNLLKDIYREGLSGSLAA